MAVYPVKVNTQFFEREMNRMPFAPKRNKFHSVNLASKSILRARQSTIESGLLYPEH